MLFRALDTYLTNTTVRTMPHLNNYIGTLNTRRQMITSRFTNAVGYESHIVVLLRKILADADIPQLMKKASDLDCYLDVLMYTQKDLNQIFDATMTGVSYSNLLIAKNPKNTAEFLIPVQCSDPLQQLPFDQGWDAWETVSPIRLVDLDSRELTFNFYQDQIVFKSDFPTRAVITIDVVALVLQYINFLKIDTTGMYQPEYLHHYVLVHILRDLEDLWLGNIYSQALLSTSPKKDMNVDINEIMADNFYGYVGVELPTALKEIFQFIQLVRDGNLYPASFINGLRTSNTTIDRYLVALLNTTTIADLRQYNWMEYLRDIRWLRILYDCYSLIPNYIGTTNLIRSLRRDMPIMYATRFWSNCHDPKTRQYIEDDMKLWMHRIGY